MKCKFLLRNVSIMFLSLLMTNYYSQGQTFPGTLTVTNGNIDLSGAAPGQIRFNNGTITGGVGGIGSLFFSMNANNILALRAGSNLILQTNTSRIDIQAATGTFVGGTFADPNNAAQFSVVPNGTRNNIVHWEAGTFGDINSTNSKWLGLGSSPPASGANAYGKRIQWGQNFAVFNLRQQSATDRNLVVQWGGTTANNQLLFEYANDPFAAATTVMQLESNGNVGIGGTPSTTDKLRVNGRIRFGSAEWIEDGGANTIRSSSSIIPSIDNARDLGSATFRWDDVFATNGVIQTSDRRAKKDIKSLNYGLAELMKLRPVTYKWKKDETKGEQIGLIAQEVQKIMTELVYDPKLDKVYNEEGQLVARVGAEDMKLGISYSAFIPVIINAVQEQQQVLDKQQALIKEQQNKITELLAKLESITKNFGDNEDSAFDNDPEQTDPKMIQNSPNPFNKLTNIDFFLPQTIQNATLYIYNMNGGLISKYKITDRGASSLAIKANTLNPGIYLYTIVADNKELGVKRMIIED